MTLEQFGQFIYELIVECENDEMPLCSDRFLLIYKPNETLALDPEDDEFYGPMVIVPPNVSTDLGSFLPNGLTDAELNQLCRILFPKKEIEKAEESGEPPSDNPTGIYLNEGAAERIMGLEDLILAITKVVTIDR